ncbi:molybdenum cofactor biosynthesis protein MoaE [Pelagibacterium halotolerans]|uniref:Molybdopterin synthase catalytic subunit n=1 Tax=Pelagibacterium halotolerans (strain DSM 22347 / JCM 15775 / CGMCC 1.7692 / B2) TaxID=1082931 RepID=G4R680_PELHB|nr:molybdenum cofactor biosynthesis protein MoaE [Pelagibacterium halotolerans]AEQ52173.1 molybdenum cofactor biosynthesis protein MoaE, molybdopterin converting factor subunit 2 [Pelagibacterium halotolerans B2]QJR18066.1 molybdenum cofactor biosynthesis protein MoaE [Pelagibacterium halotolerans]SDZ85017.1 molybdopterin synthase subunit MoaE [Pelagibacterium halotolerans]
MSVTLQSEPFDPGTLFNAFLETHHDAGAAVTFTGLVRSTANDPVISMTLEHYPALAQRQLEDLRASAMTRFALRDAEIIHRFGKLYPGEPIVQVMTLAPHRQAAFDGANFIMDILKTTAPFWKKEEGPDGAKWVEAKEGDDKATARWS